MDHPNPFAPLPTQSVAVGESTVLRREGQDIVTPINTTWPARCIKCNASVPAADYVAKVQWVPRWVIFVFVLSNLIGLILFFVKRRRFTLQVGLCAEHRAARTRNMWIGGAVMGAGALFVMAGISMDIEVLGILGGMAALGGLIGLAIASNLFRIMKVEGDFAWVRGSGPFYDSLG